MYVCICKAVTDHTIREEIKKGADSVKAIVHKLRVGTVCAKCIEEVRELLLEVRLESRLDAGGELTGEGSLGFHGPHFFRLTPLSSIRPAFLHLFL